MDERRSVKQAPVLSAHEDQATTFGEARLRFDQAVAALVAEARFEPLPEHWSEIDVFERATALTRKP